MAQYPQPRDENHPNLSYRTKTLNHLYKTFPNLSITNLGPPLNLHPHQITIKKAYEQHCPNLN